MAIPQEVVLASSVPNERPTLHLHQDSPATLLVTLTNREGTAYALDDEEHVVTLDVREYEGASTTYFTVDCDISAGKASVTVAATDVPYAGIFVGEFCIKDLSDIIQDRVRCYVAVEQSLDSDSSHRPLSIADIRMAIRDRHANDNILLNAVEFSGAEIARALIRPVSYWNETRPLVTGRSYTPATFPYTYHWEDAVIAELYLMAARGLQRNRAIVGSGGVQTDTAHRADWYQSEGLRMQEEYKQWVLEQKTAANLDSFWGRSSSPFFD